MTDYLSYIINLRAVRVAATFFAIVLAASFVYAFVDAEPAPVMPDDALFEVRDLSSLLVSTTEAGKSDAFVERPLFSENRRPPEPPPEPKKDTEVKPKVEEVEPISGVELVGIFGAGDMSGAILRFEDGDRLRVYVGDSVKGWRLDKVEPRKISLVAPNGRKRSSLEMKFAVVNPLPVVKVMPDSADIASDGSEALDPQTPENSSGEAEENTTYVPTFDAIYERRRQEQEQQAATENEAT